MPWTMKNPPKVALNWDFDRRQKCVRAANAVINRGGSDEDAIFACIAASKHNKKQGDDEEYDKLSERAAKIFKRLVIAYFALRLTKGEFERSFRENIASHFMAMMTLALGRKATAREEALLRRYIERENLYFDGFLASIDDLSEARATWRAGLYGYSRHVYTAYTIPIDVTELMPFLPGDDCLGGDLCHCSLDIQYNSDGDALVYWVLDPASESCEVCISHAVESPFIFTAAQLRGEQNDG